MKYYNTQTNEEVNLIGNYTTQTGETICNPECLSDDEKRALNLYPVTENLPAFDSRYQFLTNPIYTLKDSVVELTYTVENNVSIYPKLVEQRLADFAKEKDIDLSEVGLLMNCNVVTWRSEAEKFMNLYTATWTAFYNANANLTDWKEIEATLPVLVWVE